MIDAQFITLANNVCRARAERLNRSSWKLTREGQLEHYHRILEAEAIRRELLKALGEMGVQEIPAVDPEADRLAAAIRRHREQTRGQRMCWENDFQLWRALRERDQPDHRPPGWFSFLWNCIRYRWSRRGCWCSACGNEISDATLGRGCEP